MADIFLALTAPANAFNPDLVAGGEWATGEQPDPAVG